MTHRSVSWPSLAIRLNTGVTRFASYSCDVRAPLFSSLYGFLCYEVALDLKDHVEMLLASDKALKCDEIRDRMNVPQLLAFKILPIGSDSFIQDDKVHSMKQTVYDDLSSFYQSRPSLTDLVAEALNCLVAFQEYDREHRFMQEAFGAVFLASINAGSILASTLWLCAKHMEKQKLYQDVNHILQMRLQTSYLPYKRGIWSI